jgi:hypothetical protein
MHFLNKNPIHSSPFSNHLLPGVTSMMTSKWNGNCESSQNGMNIPARMKIRMTIDEGKYIKLIILA